MGDIDETQRRTRGAFFIATCLLPYQTACVIIDKRMVLFISSVGRRECLFDVGEGESEIGKGEVKLT